MCCDVIRKSMNTEQRPLTLEEAEDLLERACFAQQLEVLPCMLVYFHASKTLTTHNSWP